jgi:CheY-like chemotaxis protein
MNLFKKNLNVLVADDDAEEHSKFISALKISPHKISIDSVYNGMQLMNHLLKNINNKHSPNLILTDLYMPFAGGLQVLKQIKTHHDLKHIPIYVFSKNFDNTIRAKVLENGAAEFYKKPESSAEFETIIHSILEKDIHKLGLAS